MSEYQYHIVRVEYLMAARFREKLAMAKSATEMFRVFSKFKVLLDRPVVHILLCVSVKPNAG